MEGEPDQKPELAVEDDSKGGIPPHRFSVENQRAYRERITNLHERLDKLVPRPRNIKRRKKRSRIHLLEDLRVLLQALYSDDKMLPLLQGAMSRQKGDASAMSGTDPLQQTPQLPSNISGRADSSFSSITQRMLLSQPQLQGMPDQQFGMALHNMQSQGFQAMPNMQPPNPMMMPDFGANFVGQQLPQHLYMQQPMAYPAGMDRITAFDPANPMSMNLPNMEAMNKLMKTNANPGYNNMSQYAPAVAVRIGQNSEGTDGSTDPNAGVSSSYLGSTAPSSSALQAGGGGAQVGGGRKEDGFVDALDGSG
eukprot:CAMPEP_0196737154 /NCGR_PEP_ID=MMETSP1091-20130531/14979_1 /TAXON_ID=302021 /ORGANISM="Rhodomonas sp., Strain CCMP768" /LENGTH=307 /DNA_ID=CAMNT_0042080967 /DNA_START=150 /DNA_END=1069 /DNA_ORIENTATION=-